jgi:hypothetical protein
MGVPGLGREASAANERQSMPAGHHLGGKIGRHMCVS